MENLSIGDIAARNMEGEELTSMWYLRSIETAICSLSKCPAATYELLRHLEDANCAVAEELKEAKKIFAENLNEGDNK